MTVILHNGQIVPAETALISPVDRGFTLGDGVFDTMLVENGKLVHADLHFRRLHHDAAVLHIPHSWIVSGWLAMAEKLVAAYGCGTGRYALRTTLTRGPGERGLAPPETPAPTLIMRLSPATDLQKLPPVHAIIAKTVRRNDLSALSRIKSLNYGDNLLALLEAQNNDRNEAILMNTRGDVTCATTSNIFIRQGNAWFTPPVSDGVLPGIERHLMMVECGAHEQTITPSRLKDADEVWITNSILGRRRIQSIDA